MHMTNKIRSDLTITKVFGSSMDATGIWKRYKTNYQVCCKLSYFLS